MTHTTLIAGEGGGHGSDHQGPPGHDAQVALVEQYLRAQGLFADADAPTVDDPAEPASAGAEPSTGAESSTASDPTTGGVS